MFTIIQGAVHFLFTKKNIHCDVLYVLVIPYIFHLCHVLFTVTNFLLEKCSFTLHSQIHSFHRILQGQVPKCESSIGSLRPGFLFSTGFYYLRLVELEHSWVLWNFRFFMRFVCFFFGVGDFFVPPNGVRFGERTCRYWFNMVQLINIYGANAWL